MKPQTIDDSSIRTYLLGGLSADIEEKIDYLLGDHSFSSKVEEVEERIINDYVRGRLVGEELESFKKRFLNSPYRQEKIALKQALFKAIEDLSYKEEDEAVHSDLLTPRFPVETPPFQWTHNLHNFFHGQPSLLTYGLAAAALLMLAGGVWFFMESFRLRDLVNQLNAAKTDTEQLRQQLDKQEQQYQAELQKNEARVKQQLDDQARQHQDQIKKMEIALKAGGSGKSGGLNPQPGSNTSTNYHDLLISKADSRLDFAEPKTKGGGGQLIPERGPLTIDKNNGLAALRIPLNKIEGDERYYAVEVKTMTRTIVTQTGLQPSVDKGKRYIYVIFPVGLFSDANEASVTLLGMKSLGEPRENQRIIAEGKFDIVRR